MPWHVLISRDGNSQVARQLTPASCFKVVVQRLKERDSSRIGDGVVHVCLTGLCSRFRFALCGGRRLGGGFVGRFVGRCFGGCQGLDRREGLFFRGDGQRWILSAQALDEGCGLGSCGADRGHRPLCGDIDARAPEDLDGVAAVVGDGQLEFFHVVIGSCGSGSRFGDHLQGCEVFAAVERLKVAVGEFPQR